MLQSRYVRDDTHATSCGISIPRQNLLPFRKVTKAKYNRQRDGTFCFYVLGLHEILAIDGTITGSSSVPTCSGCLLRRE